MSKKDGYKESSDVRQDGIFVTDGGKAATRGSLSDIRSDISIVLSQKDTGYAWVILTTCVLSNIITSCMLSISGVLFLELGVTFDEASKVQLSIATTSQFAVSRILGIFAGLLVSRFGSKRMMMLGSLISTASVFATSFAPTITAFTAMYLVSSFGTSIMHMSSLVKCSQYFEKHKALSFGLQACGYSISYFFWPPFVTVLFEHYGWRSGFMILAGFQLQGCVLAAMMRSFIEDDRKEVQQQSTSLSSHLLSQCQVFKNKRCMFFLLVTCTAQISYMFCPAYCPTIGRGLGATATNAALLVSVQGVCSGVSRISNGIIGDVPFMRSNRLLITTWSYTMAGVSKVCSAAVASYEQAVVFAVADGLADGSFTSALFTIVTDMVDKEQVPFACGIFAMGLGISTLGGNVFSGWLYSYFGSLYEPAFILGGVQVFAGILAACLYIAIKVGDRKVADKKMKNEVITTRL